MYLLVLMMLSCRSGRAAEKGKFSKVSHVKSVLKKEKCGFLIVLLLLTR